MIKDSLKLEATIFKTKKIDLKQIHLIFLERFKEFQGKVKWDEKKSIL